MKKNNINRIVFFSKEDMSWNYNLITAEVLLNRLDFKIEFEVNDLLEFYNIKLYFDHNLFLTSWDDSVKNNYIELVNKTWVITKEYWLKIDSTNVLMDIENLELCYQQSYWELINNLHVYKKINTKVFISILDKFPFTIYSVLSIRNIVKHFDMEIKEFLINYEKSAEFILMKYEEKERHNDSKYFIPNSLNLSDKESIIDKYLDCKDPNLNYVRLVENSKDSKDLKLSPKTRLKSKKKSTELNNKILERGNLTKVGIEITFDKDQIKPRESYHEGHILKVAYSEKYLDEHNNNIELFHLFATLFGFIDNQGLVTLVNKESEMETMERILMKSKNEYSEGLVFQKKHALSKMQIHIFNDYLNRRGLSLEKVIESFINDYLNSSLEKGKFQFRFPTENSTYLEKIRALLPEFEFLLKQYQIYVNEGEIDFELLELDSNPLRFSEIKSLTNRKYVYIDSDLIRNLRYIFFSDQSGLYYTETYKDKYTDFYNLLINENVKLVDFAHYQIVMINQLINEDYLHIDATGCVRINKIIMIYLISLLYNNEVLVYWHFPESSRRVIDDMIIKKQLSFEQTLFTKQEINYYNFFLNKKEFTNGADLRNKYLHGTNTNSEDEHQNDYYVLMKIIILTLLKIEDDIVVNELAKSPI